MRNLSCVWQMYVDMSAVSAVCIMFKLILLSLSGKMLYTVQNTEASEAPPTLRQTHRGITLWLQATQGNVKVETLVKNYKSHQQ